MREKFAKNSAKLRKIISEYVSFLEKTAQEIEEHPTQVTSKRKVDGKYFATSEDCTRSHVQSAEHLAKLFGNVLPNTKWIKRNGYEFATFLESHPEMFSHIPQCNDLSPSYVPLKSPIAQVRDKKNDHPLIASCNEILRLLGAELTYDNRAEVKKLVYEMHSRIESLLAWITKEEKASQIEPEPTLFDDIKAGAEKIKGDGLDYLNKFAAKNKDNKDLHLNPDRILQAALSHMPEGYNYCQMTFDDLLSMNTMEEGESDDRKNSN